MSTEILAALDSTFEYDPFSKEAMSDPLPLYKYLRAHHPIYFMPKYDMFALSRFDDVYEMLSYTDNTFVATEGTQPSPDALRIHNNGHATYPSTDSPMPPYSYFGSPVHEAIRQGHVAPMRPGAVKQLESFIREQARQRLDLLLPRGHFDLTQHYGGIVAASVQCNLFRLPLTEAKYILDTVNARSLTDPERGGHLSNFEEQNTWFMEIVESLVRTRRKEGPDGSFPLVDGMLELRLDGRALTDTEIARTIGVIMIGGTETVPKVVAHGLWELQRRPDQMAAVRADLEHNAGTAFKEMVRYCGPAQWFARTVHKPVTIGGQEMKVGQRVIFLIPSAARDEREYGLDSEEFRWNREIKRWVNFAWGQQFCTGYHLALLEGRILVEEFLRRVPDFEVDERSAVRRPSSFQWGWNELPIRVPISV